MTESMHALSGAYVVDALDDQERERFEQHLSGCADCQDEVASLREAAVLMAHEAATPPPARLRANVLSAITTVRPLPPLQRTDPMAGMSTHTTSQATPVHPLHEEPAAAEVAPVVPLRRRRSRLAGLAAAAAVLVVVGGGAVAWHPWRDDTSTTQLSAADRVLAAPDASRYSLDLKDGSNATVVRSANQGKAVVLTQGMAAPPSGKVYEAWLRDASGRLHPAGLMRGSGDHKLLLTGNVAKATGVGITVEPARGSTTPTSAPIAMFDLDQGSA